MKRSRLSYDEWKCILSKDMQIKRVDTELLKGHMGLINIHEVSEPQIWKFNGQDIVVCDKGIKWLTILPEADWYCITAMLSEKGESILWYIDMIAGQGIDQDGVPYFDDLYLDLVVHPDGTIIVDDMDELEEALDKQDITPEQFELAVRTSEKLKKGILSNIDAFIAYTGKCCELFHI